jgi:1-deoxy-D-xylulose-5-phosphate reductoisomerase
LARQAGELGGTLPAVFNAANEVAVERFCRREIGFLDITRHVRAVMEAHQRVDQPSLDQILDADRWARTVQV